MNNRSVKLSAICAVLASFCAFFAVSGALDLLLESAVPRELAILASVVPYVGGWLCAVGVLRLSANLLPDRDAEEESPVFGEDEEISQHKYSLKQDIYASAVSLAVLLCANFLTSLFTDGASPDFTLTALLIGVLVKPFCEETYFRYGIPIILMRSGGLSRSVSIAVSAILFALVHKPSAMIFALGAGAVLGALATRSAYDRIGFRRGAVRSLAVHAAYNLILYLILYWRCL